MGSLYSHAVILILEHGEHAFCSFEFLVYMSASAPKRAWHALRHLQDRTISEGACRREVIHMHACFCFEYALVIALLDCLTIALMHAVQMLRRVQDLSSTPLATAAASKAAQLCLRSQVSLVCALLCTCPLKAWLHG